MSRLRQCDGVECSLQQEIELPFSVAIAAYLNGQFYGQVTVATSAVLSRGSADRKVDIVGRAISSCVFDRLLDVFILLALASS